MYLDGILISKLFGLLLRNEGSYKMKFRNQNYLLDPDQN